MIFSATSAPAFTFFELAALVNAGGTGVTGLVDTPCDWDELPSPADGTVVWMEGMVVVGAGDDANLASRAFRARALDKSALIARIKSVTKAPDQPSALGLGACAAWTR